MDITELRNYLDSLEALGITTVDFCTVNDETGETFALTVDEFLDPNSILFIPEPKYEEYINELIVRELEEVELDLRELQGKVSDILYERSEKWRQSNDVS